MLSFYAQNSKVSSSQPLHIHKCGEKSDGDNSKVFMDERNEATSADSYYALRLQKEESKDREVIAWLSMSERVSVS